MKTIVVAGAMLAGSVFAAVPVIDPASISARQDGDHTVIIGYTMNPATEGDTDPAIITVDVLTNYTENAEVKWASIGGEHFTTLTGDVNKVIAHTVDYKHNILWDPTKEGLPNFKFDANEIKVEITAWATNSPPAYWIIDLAHPADRSYDRYYPNAEQIPLTVTNILYKTDRLVMRRIPAKGVTWKMGSTETAGNYRYHYVTFSYDYWMAIYEMTNSQFRKLNNTTTVSDDAFPMSETFENFRGDPVGDSSYNWPSNGHDKVGGQLATIRTTLGGIMLDYPTHSEWEFACRAGSTTKYCCGDSTSGLANVAWYAKANDKGHEVGTKEPNAWGMYDMHGNVAEWTLDKCTELSADPVWDPTGPMQDDATDGKNSAVCGGDYNSTAAQCASGTGVGYQKAQVTRAARLTIPIQ